uniref:BEACH domain-containing protein n=1 Tax=Haemonchus contortus TaxID=6289 RepID=A0A7I4YL66_HAECO
VSLTPRFKVQHRGDIKRSHSPPTVVCGEIGFYPIQRWSLPMKKSITPKRQVIHLIDSHT